ncbi:light-inducible protein CPRF2-like [Alnus glutinosa]|uniref:light-inducible protein CPRF2-like n=1 Tax=Alnus glutinosa TaxID=3517 RepID=UPI002D77D291|nr:light-inducible protein CPRF2-like [Alnus glutinosa]
MLSAYRVPLPVDTMFGNPFSAFDAGFTPWDCPEFFPSIQSPEPVFSNSGSEALIPSPAWEPDAFHSPKPVISSSGSDDPDQGRNPNHLNSNSGSDEPKPRGEVSPVDERKRRRMISNRESARRSRMRKQKHLENLRNQANRFRIENRDLSNRLRFFLYHCHRVQTENNQLRSESDMLRHRLLEIKRIMVFRRLQQPTTAWPCNTAMSEPIPPLIA